MLWLLDFLAFIKCLHVAQFEKIILDSLDKILEVELVNEDVTVDAQVQLALNEFTEKGVKDLQSDALLLQVENVISEVRQIGNFIPFDLVEVSHIVEHLRKDTELVSSEKIGAGFILDVERSTVITSKNCRCSISVI